MDHLGSLGRGRAGELATYHQPQSVLANIPYHGAIVRGKDEVPHYVDIEPAAVKVPTLYLIGQNDIATIILDGKAQFLRDRARGAQRALVLQPGADHLALASHELALAWVEAVFRLRMPADADPRRGPVQLKALKEEDGWLGDNETHEIAAFKDYKGKKASASWLPDEATAKLWQACVDPKARRK